MTTPYRQFLLLIFVVTAYLVSSCQSPSLRSETPKQYRTLIVILPTENTASRLGLNPENSPYRFPPDTHVKVNNLIVPVTGVPDLLISRGIPKDEHISIQRWARVKPTDSRLVELLKILKESGYPNYIVCQMGTEVTSYQTRSWTKSKPAQQAGADDGEQPRQPATPDL